MAHRIFSIPTLVLSAIVCLCGCKADTAASRSPSDGNILSPSELSHTEKNASRGDVIAMWRLIDHYRGQRDEQEYWLRAAISKGDAAAMDRLAAMITFDHPGKEQCFEAEQLHLRAIQSAKTPAHRADLESSLEILRNGFRDQGPCIEWLR